MKVTPALNEYFGTIYKIIMKVIIYNIYAYIIIIISIIIIRFRYKYLGNCRSIAACRDNYP